MSTQQHQPTQDASLSRRTFLETTAAASAATLFAELGTNFAHAQGGGKLKIGLVGCGGRGSGAAKDCLEASPDTELYAMGDLFEDNGLRSRDRLKEALGDRINVPNDRVFKGWDAYKGVLASGVDYMILATPPHFRPVQVAASIEAGKHVFMEKPVAVDPVGVRKILAAAELAEKKGLSIVAGTQRRHQRGYLECLKQIQDGAIGDVVSAHCYWNQGGLWSRAKLDEWSDMEWQIRNWLYFTWLAGDHIVEQHLHNIDVMNWALGKTPTEAYSIGGRQTRTEKRFGHVFDHFVTEFRYDLDGRDVIGLSMCRQQNGTYPRIGEYVFGTKGAAYMDGNAKSWKITGENPWRYRSRKDPSPYLQEHADLVAAIQSGKPLNEGQRMAESTMTAIMGRMSAYTGKIVKWDDALNADLDLTPPKYEFGPLPIPKVAVPGRTPLVYNEWEVEEDA